jgi:hypothetical protein
MIFLIEDLKNDEGSEEIGIENLENPIFEIEEEEETEKAKEIEEIEEEKIDLQD